jgi:hypothetical protein
MKYKTKGKKASCAEDTRDLLKLALEEKPNAFREVFDEIMLAKIVDISDEMKDEISQSMFGESSHKYGKKKPNGAKKDEMKESFEPDEDEDEDDVGDEDEDFDISDEDLEDLDLDDLDFEEDEDEIEESYETVETNKKESARLRQSAASKRRDAESLKDDHRFSRRFMGDQLSAEADDEQKSARLLGVRNAKLQRRRGA